MLSSRRAPAALASGTEEGKEGAEGGSLCIGEDSGDTTVFGWKDLLSGGADCVIEEDGHCFRCSGSGVLLNGAYKKRDTKPFNPGPGPAVAIVARGEATPSLSREGSVALNGGGNLHQA